MLKRGELKRETETILCGAQEQSLRVNAIYSIDKTSDTTLHCTVDSAMKRLKVKHIIVSTCSIFAKSQYRKCLVKVGTLFTQLGLTLTINVIFNIHVNTCVQLYNVCPTLQLPSAL